MTVSSPSLLSSSAILLEDASIPLDSRLGNFECEIIATLDAAAIIRAAFPR
jgi:hypothetical protein